MSSFEVPTPILNSAFEEPEADWYFREAREPEQREGRRPSIAYPPKEGTHEWDLGGVLSPSKDFDPGYEMTLAPQASACRNERSARFTCSGCCIGDR